MKRYTLFFSIVFLLIMVFYFYPTKKNHSDMVWIPGGDFMMGSNSRMARANEKPAHKVHVDGFWMDKTDVTNAQFAKFVKATGYITTAERKPDWDTLKVQLPFGTPKPSDDKLIAGAMVFIGTDHSVTPTDWPSWWTFMPGADWQHPHGPRSDLKNKFNHPVVQISYEDALAYAKWARKKLPTEAQWEFAARGGLEQKEYAWGDEFQPKGKRMANTFVGKTFPIVDPEYQAMIDTSPVAQYPANGYGLYDMAGNVWQWVADWYRADAFTEEARGEIACINPKGPTTSFDPAEPNVPEDAPKRVIRGGSFLCDQNFCTSYRPSARRGIDPFNPMSHIGFRLVVIPAKAGIHLRPPQK